MMASKIKSVGLLPDELLAAGGGAAGAAFCSATTISPDLNYLVFHLCIEQQRCQRDFHLAFENFDEAFVLNLPIFRDLLDVFA